MDAALAAVRPGVTEDDAVAELLRLLPGVRTPVVLAAADARIAGYRHPLPGATPIRTRVMLVLVAERWGLHVALTRIRELEAPSAELARRIEGVAAVQTAMHAATRPGATLGDVFAAARAAYADVGFPDEWRDHHQGGPIGYQARERIALPDDPTIIEPGMAFAWNPSIAGAKREDTTVIADGVARTVTAE
jgi:antitoxin VapB